MHFVANRFEARTVEFEMAEDGLKIILPELYEVSIALQDLFRGRI